MFIRKDNYIINTDKIEYFAESDGEWIMVLPDLRLEVSTETVEKITKQMAMEAEPPNRHLRRPNLSTVYKATKVDAKLTIPKTMEVWKESFIPTALKIVVP